MDGAEVPSGAKVMKARRLVRRRSSKRGFRSELRATRSLEFEYAEALRAGGAKDSGSFRFDGLEDGRCGRSSECSGGKDSGWRGGMVRGRTCQRFMEFEVAGGSSDPLDAEILGALVLEAQVG